MEEVEEICKSIGIIDHGKLIAEGTKEQLKSTITEVSNFNNCFFKMKLGKMN